MPTSPTITRTARMAAGAAVAVLLVGASVATASASASGQDAGAAARFVSQINSERASAGRPRLAVSSALTSVAGSWAASMARSGQLAHNPNLARSVRGWKYLGENVGVGDSVASLESAFYASSPHRANMLDSDYTLVGVAVVHGGGRLWVAEEFMRPSGAGASASHSSGTAGHHAGTATAPRAAVDKPARKPSAQQLAKLRQLQRAFTARHDGWAPSLAANALRHWLQVVTSP